MDNDVNLIILNDGTVLISKIDRTIAIEIGDPDYILTKPFVCDSNGTLSSWLSEFTIENKFKIGSDKIITMTVPKPDLLKNYLEKII